MDSSNERLDYAVVLYNRADTGEVEEAYEILEELAADGIPMAELHRKKCYKRGRELGIFGPPEPPKAISSLLSLGSSFMGYARKNAEKVERKHKR